MQTSTPIESRPETWPASSPPVEESEGIDFIDLLLYLLHSKRQIALGTSLFLIIGLVVALLLKPVFTAVAVIMPPQQQQSVASALVSQIGALGSLGGVSALSGLKNPADMYVGMLKSRLIADSLLDRFQLEFVYRSRLRVEARRHLSDNTEFEAAKDGLIYIRVKDHDAKRAAALANAYIEELHRTNSRLAIGEAAQRRLFYDEQLTDERKELASAEDNLKKTQEKTGVIQLNGQAEMTIRNIASVQAQIASREVELEVARTFATDQNPDVAQYQQEIVSLQSQLAKLENAQRHMVPGDVQVPSEKVPEVGLEYLRKLREVRYHESLFELLAKQREVASLDEAKSAPVIQVVDPADVPERKSGPSRMLITLGAGFAGLLLCSAWAIVAGALAAIRSVPSQAARLDELQQALSFHKA